MLADSPLGQRKEAELSRKAPSESPTYGDIRHGFVYQRVPHVTLKSIANNTEIDVVHERMHPLVEAALADLNVAMRGQATSFKVENGGREGDTLDFTAADRETVTLPSGESAPVNGFLEWEVPREAPDHWNDAARDALKRFWEARRIPVLKARMNADLHMAEDLKKTDKANLFVIFGEPDIVIEPAAGPDQELEWLQVKINGVDVFDPSTGEVRSDGPDGIACWFVDTDYNEESFFVRQAYFLGAGDPYKSLKTTLKAEVDAEAWATLHSDTSRPFPKPSTGQIAVKVINHLGDEVMKVFGV